MHIDWNKMSIKASCKCAWDTMYVSLTKASPNNQFCENDISKW